MHALLDGNWRIARDPENRGREGKWYDAIPQGAPTWSTSAGIRRPTGFS